MARTHTHLSDIIRDQNPLILPPEMTVLHACRKMQRRRVGAVLVATPDGRLLGIFTGRDAVWRVVAKGRDARTETLAEVMTPRPDTMSPHGTAIDALRLMRVHGVVKSRRAGRMVFYSLTDGHVRLLLDTAMEHVGHAHE